ncbi:MAG: hypothetical protein RIS64_2593 [Bacteroidota bacterium]|jgi:hypothetical protein
MPFFIKNKLKKSQKGIFRFIFDKKKGAKKEKKNFFAPFLKALPLKLNKKNFRHLATAYHLFDYPRYLHQ